MYKSINKAFKWQLKIIQSSFSWFPGAYNVIANKMIGQIEQHTLIDYIKETGKNNIYIQSSGIQETKWLSMGMMYKKLPRS